MDHTTIWRWTQTGVLEHSLIWPAAVVVSVEEAEFRDSAIAATFEALSDVSGGDGSRGWRRRLAEAACAADRIGVASS